MDSILCVIFLSDSSTKGSLVTVYVLAAHVYVIPCLVRMLSESQKDSLLNVDESVRIQ